MILYNYCILLAFQVPVNHSVKHKYEDDITSITVSYKDNAIEDIKEYRKMLSNIFGDILIIE